MIIKNFRAKENWQHRCVVRKIFQNFHVRLFKIYSSNSNILIIFNITHKIIFIQPCRAVLTIVNSAYLKKKRPMGHITHLNSIIHFKISFIESYTNSVDKEVDYSPICFINDTRLGCKRGLHNYTN